MKKELNIIEEIGAEGFENSLILTFNCSLVFYERLILSELLSAGCGNNIILMDHRQYDDLINSESSKVQQCGSYYICERIKVGGAFHPKIVLLTGKDKGKLLVGSGNNTFFGYGKNFEVFTKFEYSKEHPEYLSVFQDALAYAESVHDKFRTSNNPAFANRIKLLRDKTPWLDAKPVPCEEKFVHNLDESLMDQVLTAAPRDINRIVVGAPYFDNDLEILGRYKAQFPKAEITVLTQSENTNFPIGYFLANPKLFSSITLRRIKGAAVDERDFHAKFIYMTNGKFQLLFSGSANQSTAALNSRGGEANQEAGILLTSENKKAHDFAEVWESLVEAGSVTKPDDLIRRDFGEQLPSIVSSVRITDAYVDGTRLQVVYESKDGGAGELILNGNLVSPVALEKKGDVSIDVGLQVQSENCLVVQIRTKVGQSNLMWVSNAHIRSVNARSPITKQVNELSQYIDDQSFVMWLVGLSPNLALKKSGGEDIFKGLRKMEEEEAETSTVELPKEMFFVEEKADYRTFLENSSNPTRYEYTDDALSSLLDILNRGIQYYVAPSQEPDRVAPLEEDDEKSTAEQATADEDTEEEEEPDVRDYVLRKINRLIDKTAERIEDDRVTLGNPGQVTGLLMTAASLVWFLEGIEVSVPNQEKIRISLRLHRYLRSSQQILGRLWMQPRKGDYLSGVAKDADIEYLGMSNVFLLSLLLLTFNFRTIYERSRTGEDLRLQDSIVTSYFGLISKLKTIPQAALNKMFSKERIANINSKLGMKDLEGIDLIKVVNSRVDEATLRAVIATKNKAWVARLKRSLEASVEPVEKELRKLEASLQSRTDRNALGYELAKMQLGSIWKELERIENYEKSEEARGKTSTSKKVDANVLKLWGLT